MGAKGVQAKASSLFVPFRALGLVTEGVPFVTQRRGREIFITLSVGTSWQIYNSSSLRLRLIGPPLLVSGRRTRKKSGEDDEVISCLGCKGDLTFAAIGSKIIECKRIHRRGVYTLYGDTGSDDQIVEMMVLGSRILGRTAAGCIAVWHIGEYGEPVSECWPKTEADGVEGKATCMAHPHTYLNKVLVGMSNGAMQLWNFSTNKMIYEFEAFDSSVVCIEPSLALDVVGVGLASGMVVLKDIKKNVTLLELDNASGAGTKADMFLSNSVDSIHHRSMSSGSCGCIAFGMSQSLPLMATGGASGVISVWNLETQTLHAIIRDAHDGSLSKLEFLDGHPILVSTADDNSIKEWIFDGTDGQPRLLRFRSGHASPPTIVRHYADSTKLLSGGQDRAFRFFSTVQDAQSREISQGHVQRRAKKLKITEQELKLTRIVSLDACDVRERDWSNVITAHENDTSAYVWRIQKFAQGEFVLRPPRVNNDNLAPVSSVCLSRCGNFGFVGSSSGRIDRYNMQSGLHRGTYQCSGGYSAHAGAVSGLACDGCNRYLVSGGLDSMMKCWNMKTRKLQGEMDLGSKIGKIAFHPTTCLVAVACDDGVIRLCDVEAMTIVRRFKGHSDRITDIQFSQDCRWLLSASMDSTLRIWDVPGSTILQVLQMDSPITSLSLAPAMDVLVTTHVEKRGLYTWTNELIFGSVENIITSSKPIRATIPDMSMERIAKGLAGDQEKKKSGANPAMLVHSTQRANDALDALESESSSGEDDSSISMHADDAGGSSEEESDDDVQDEEKRVEILKRDQEVLSGQEPVAPEMITLSMLPRSQWLNLVHIDSIKTRNKPIEPPKKPEAAPFFLPTVSSANAGRDPVFAVDESDERLAREAEAAWGGNASDESGDDADDEKTLGETTRIHKAGAEDAVNQRESGLIPLLTSYKKDKKWTPVVQYLKSLSPSNLDIQLRSLALANIDGTIDHDVLITFLALLADAISSDTNFEFLQALLRAFILIHGEIISEHEDMKHVAATVQQQTTKAWNRICHTLQHTQCMVGLLGSMQT